MTRKKHKPEEVVAKLRQVNVLVSLGRRVTDAIRAVEVTYHRRRRNYGGSKSDQAKRLKELETENAGLRRAVSNLTLDKLFLREAAAGNW